MDSTSVINKQLLSFRFFGLLPACDSSYFYHFWSLITFLMAGTGIVTCQLISIIYVPSTDDLVKELLLFCTTSTVAVKIILFHLKRRHFLNVLDILTKVDRRVETQNDVDIMLAPYANCLRISIIYSCVYIGAIVTLFFELIFLERSEHTWKSTAPIPSSWAQQPSIYYCVLIFEAICNSTNCAISWTLDTCSLKLANLLCGHIEVLSLHLKEIGREKKTSMENSKRLLKYLDHYDLLAKLVCMRRITKNIQHAF